MRLGSITSLNAGVARDVDIEISRAFLFSSIAEPSGRILADEVTGIEVIENAPEGELVYQLFLDLVDGEKVRFYASRSKFDVALILNELEGAGVEVPRRWGA